MGDRANVKILQRHAEGSVYLYTHWGGSALASTLQRALMRKQRWDDEAYLARIIFSEMVKGAEEAPTGCGIATSPPDNGHQIRTVDCKDQYVRIGPQDKDPIHNIPFETFIGLSPAELDEVYFAREDEG